MKIPFTKYQGAGNDFIIIDNRNKFIDKINVAELCHPKFGIGGDGLMLLQNIEGYDFEMVYYNSDGNISTMCGNGGRCIVDFAAKLGVFSNSKTRFKAIDGPHDAVWQDSYVELQMNDVSKIEQRENAYILNTGSPHYVIFTTNVDEIDIVTEAKKIRYNNEFKQDGINVNFVEIVNSQTLKVRTYERGVENETLSCGTGVTACAIALSKHQNFAPTNQTISIQTPGGELSVKYSISDTIHNVWLCGPAVKVFEGTVEQSAIEQSNN